MPLDVDSFLDLQKYLSGVIDRADHHASNVNEVALALLGAIIWKIDNNKVKVFTREGEMKNVLWVYIHGKKYAFSYDHDNGAIEMRERSTQGAVVASFNNQTTNTKIKEIFSKLP